MEWLNYHHLLYFWTVARTGGVSAASKELRLAQPTVSGQLRVLEDQLGEKLFHRAGRRMELTEVGRVVYRYADEIFSLGRELLDTVRGRPTGRPPVLHIGVADVVPKLITYRLIEPALRLPAPVRLVCREGKADRLLAELATHELDVVLTDAPLSPSLRIKAFNHLLGECGLSIVATRALAVRYRRGFPRSLDGSPWLLPTDNTAQRRALDQWFQAQQVRPHVVSEFEDSALLKVFGERGAGLFPIPSAIESEVRRQHHVVVVGRVPQITERFYAISAERRVTHPAVLAIANAARAKLFG